MRILRVGLALSLILISLTACATGPFSAPLPSKLYVAQQLRNRLNPDIPHERGRID